MARYEALLGGQPESYRHSAPLVLLAKQSQRSLCPERKMEANIDTRYFWRPPHTRGREEQVTN